MRLSDVAEVFSGGKPLEPGDITLVRVHGNREKIGLPAADRHIQLPTNSIVVRAKPGKITPKKLLYTLEWLHRNGAFAYLAHGTCQLAIRISEIKEIPLDKVPKAPPVPRPPVDASDMEKHAFNLGIKYAELFYYTARTKGITESLREATCDGILKKLGRELIVPLRPLLSKEIFLALEEGYGAGINYLTRERGWGTFRYRSWRHGISRGR